MLPQESRVVGSDILGQSKKKKNTKAKKYKIKNSQ